MVGREGAEKELTYPSCSMHALSPNRPISVSLKPQNPLQGIQENLPVHATLSQHLPPLLAHAPTSMTVCPPPYTHGLCFHFSTALWEAPLKRRDAEKPDGGRRGGTMAPWARVIAGKPDDLSLVWTNMVEGGN